MATRSQLPIMPRRLQISLASLYVGVSETTFRKLVDEGRIKPPKRVNRNVGWDIHDLDSFVDSLPRDGEEPVNDWEGKAA